jgi:class 3 adenylate cyclase/pimeloyl-ACP methyl ester carboxylesterase
VAVQVPETHYAAVGDADVAYQVVGDGPVDLVFHHGLCHIDLQWDVPPEAAFLRALASFSRLILFDRRGTSASDRGSSEILPTWEEWSEDLRAVLDAVGSERAAIFGEAEGGATALLFAATHPERVSALILGNAWARLTVAEDYPMGGPAELADRWASVYEASWGKRELVLLGFPSLAGDDDTIASLCKLLRAAATPRAAARQIRHIIADLDVREALPSIHVPTLVLQSHGPPPSVEASIVPSSHAHARYLVDHITDARLVEIPIHDYLYFGGDFGPVIEEVAEFITGVRPRAAPDRILTTMLFTDIADSTRLAAQRGDQGWRRILDAHDQLVRQQLKNHQGREVKTTGDGFLAAFNGPGKAIRCAQAITKGAGRLGTEVRAGIHTGECEVRGEDLAGLAVHIAARVGALAQPCQVLVSRTVVDLVAGSGISFEDLGERQLKGVPGMWRLFAVEA